MDIPTARNRCEALATRRRDAAASARASADEYRTRAQDLTGDRRDLLLNIADQNDKRAKNYEQDAEAIEEILKWI